MVESTDHYPYSLIWAAFWSPSESSMAMNKTQLVKETVRCSKSQDSWHTDLQVSRLVLDLVPPTQPRRLLDRFMMRTIFIVFLSFLKLSRIVLPSLAYLVTNWCFDKAFADHVFGG